MVGKKTVSTDHTVTAIFANDAVARAIDAPSSARQSANRELRTQPQIGHRKVENIDMLAASQQHPSCHLLRFHPLSPQATLAEAMGKLRKKLLKWCSTDGRATARPPGTLSGEQVFLKASPDVRPAKNRDVSESTNASPSSLTERHVPPDLPAQVGSAKIPTVQAMSIVSPVAHAAKTHVPTPIPPLADPPAEPEPDPEAEERQPVMKPTKPQTPARPSDEETPQYSSELLRPRPSCWAMAAEQLQEARPVVYAKLEKIKSEHKNPSQSDPADLLKFAKSKMQENEGIPRVIETTIRSILQFKEVVTAAANFDPHKIAPIFWQGFCVILEVRCYFPNLNSYSLGETFLLIGMLGRIYTISRSA
jgi:hypothetical protein